MPGFSNSVQPGQTRYPNLLPVQATGYPDGSFLALEAMMGKDWQTQLQQGTEVAMDRILQQLWLYIDGTGVNKVKSPEKELANFMLKKPQLWQMHQNIFPLDCDKDFARFTILTNRAVQGDFQQAGAEYDPQHVKAVWQVAAMALGVVKHPSQLIGGGVQQ